MEPCRVVSFVREVFLVWSFSRLDLKDFCDYVIVYERVSRS